ncbi:uncharacterized protein PGTG_21450 [Puccinia graminis f. sp. tritici CRL 75-36-700-3]|uniref:Secreted protein n=1 Tax=Puccinia graminis f. sp. tritici (strain CRL 75-36-700-3 / race SCCL) TaxID=418459 RepID=H6QRG4_PUCGT|nr:uncharacterized protein PGTG_21450 [Puccinia graminis f. sp. tritici CRL 75-36-700-3]EHS63253.1 hypothetical protein PGTG_21450 [Puccinia graminis f. sp. tritici CRL 75-36-700-3]
MNTSVIHLFLVFTILVALVQCTPGPLYQNIYDCTGRKDGTRDAPNAVCLGYAAGIYPRPQNTGCKVGDDELCCIDPAAKVKGAGAGCQPA